jgi:rfaE bifunctional protein nucleotidyltransferase chain/domain
MALFPSAACLQMEIRVGDVDANLQQLKRSFVGQEPATNTLVVLPELWATGFDYPHIAALAEQTPRVLTELQQLAAKHTIWFAGSLPEKREQGAPCNTLYLTGPEGVVGRYRKHHLFSFWQEDQYLQPGSVPQPIDTPFGPLGALVCYDLRFPVISCAQTFGGCRVIVVSAQWPMLRLDHWQLLVRTRAVENQAFVVACNGCGISGSYELAGHSMIVGPDGYVLAEAGEESSFIGAELVEEDLETLRSRFCTGGERPWSGDDHNKVVGLTQLQDHLVLHRKQGSRVVFTNGCFDLLHAGHVSYLEQARQCGDCLVVGLNSDRSVRVLKGASRPINSQQARARVLASLGCVDYVVLFDEDTPRNLICSLLPDILVKGADWPEDRIVGAAEVKAAGGRVERIVFEHQLSTTDVINKIRQQESGSDTDATGE